MNADLLETPDAKLKSYELAISFKYKHNGFAKEIYNRFHKRLKTFHFEKDQDVLGNDELLPKFSTVFSNAQAVVILLDKEYGQNGATKVEKDAIYHTNINRGWNTTLIVNMEEKHFQPIWVPPGFNLINFKNFGQDYILRWIENALMTSSVLKEPETVVELLKRKQEEKQKTIEVKKYLEDLHGPVIGDSKKSFRNVMDLVRKKMEEAFKGEVSSNHKPDLRIFVQAHGGAIELYYNFQDYNTIKNSRFIATYSYFNKQDERKNHVQYFKYGLDMNKNHGWLEASSGHYPHGIDEMETSNYFDLISEDDLSERILKTYVDLRYGNDSSN